MVLHINKSRLDRSTERCAREHRGGRSKTFGSGADLRFFMQPLVAASEPKLPIHSIARKQTKRNVQAGVSRQYPAFCTVTASGSYRRPAAGSFFCFGFRRLRLRFPSSTDPP